MSAPPAEALLTKLVRKRYWLHYPAGELPRIDGM